VTMAVETAVPTTAEQAAEILDAGHAVMEAGVGMTVIVRASSAAGVAAEASSVVMVAAGVSLEATSAIGSKQQEGCQ